MSKYCGKCGTELSDDDFLCPKCGAIWGDQVYAVPVQITPETKESEPVEPPTEEPAQEPEQPERKKQPRWLVPVAAVVLILGFVLFWFGSDRELWAGHSSTPSTGSQHQSPNILPPVPGTSAPTTVPYTIQISTETEYWLKGITVHFCRNGKELWAQQVDAEGKVTFYATKGDGYSIKLSNLVPSLAYHYGDAEILLPKDSTNVSFKLENKPIDYTVRVVNEEGEPVPDVLVHFSSQRGQFVQEQVTNSEGVIVVTSDYDPDATCQILSLPNEYVMLEYGTGFEYGSFDAKVIVRTYKECNIPPEHIYTIRVEDEFGAPIKNQSVQIRYNIADDEFIFESHVFRTNQQGCITFAGSPEYFYRIKILNNPDNYQIYTFEEGSRDLNIQLIMHTYTVRFVDQYGMPIPEVEIIREEEDGLIIYSSDAEGKISFVHNKNPDESVYFLLEHPPAGYQHNDMKEGLKEFSFLDNSRNMVVEFQKSNVEYHITFSAVLPNGTSTRVHGSFDIIIGDDRYSCETDLYGKCTVELPYLSSANQISIDLTTLPEGYESYLLSEINLFEQFDWPIITLRIVPGWETPD